MPTVSQSAFRLVLARPVQTPGTDHPSLVHLSWFAAEQTFESRLIQIYVDQELYSTLPAEPNHTWLSLDREQVHVIELLAVPYGMADEDLRDQLNTWSPSYKLKPSVELPRDTRAPINASASIDTGDNQRLVTELIWPPHVPRGGFGSLFGVSPFGLDNAASPGLGLAPLGFGPLDVDAPPFNPELPPLESGVHTLRVTYSHTPDAVLETEVSVDLPHHPDTTP